MRKHSELQPCGILRLVTGLSCVTCPRPLQPSIQFALVCLAAPVSPSAVLLWPWNRPSAVAFGQSGRRCRTKSPKRLPRSQLLLRKPRPPAIGGDKCFARAGPLDCHVALPQMAAGARPKARGKGIAAFVIEATWRPRCRQDKAERMWPVS